MCARRLCASITLFAWLPNAAPVGHYVPTAQPTKDALHGAAFPAHSQTSLVQHPVRLSLLRFPLPSSWHTEQRAPFGQVHGPRCACLRCCARRAWRQVCCQPQRPLPVIPATLQDLAERGAWVRSPACSPRAVACTGSFPVWFAVTSPCTRLVGACVSACARMLPDAPPPIASLRSHYSSTRGLRSVAYDWPALLRSAEESSLPASVLEDALVGVGLVVCSTLGSSFAGRTDSQAQTH